jgi:hypothetical protein
MPVKDIVCTNFISFKLWFFHEQMLPKLENTEIASHIKLVILSTDIHISEVMPRMDLSNLLCIF